jgi:alanyl-tRNA synthetase
MPTKRLYHHDPYLTHFNAHVDKVISYENQPAVILDQTAFYPTSGGQPHDTGTLNGIAVLDVFEQDDAIIHVLAGPIQDAQVSGAIDWNRRFDHMQQHAGQHVLSRTFEALYNAETVGFHISAESSTVDIAIAAFTPEDMIRIEDKTNEIIWSNAVIHTFFPTPQELSNLALRKPPQKNEDIRVVHIQDWDCCACGGTHPRTTGEIGMLAIRRLEKHRSGIRVEFMCGNRTLHDYRRKNQGMQELAALTSMPATHIFPAVQRLIQQNTELEKRLGDMQNQLIFVETEKLIAEYHGNNPKVIAKDFPDRPPQEIRILAAKLTSHPRTIALLGSTDEGRAHLVFQRSGDLDYHMGQLLQQTLPLIGGKGGGSPQSAQGGGSKLENLHAAIIWAEETAARLFRGGNMM